MEIFMTTELPSAAIVGVTLRMVPDFLALHRLKGIDARVPPLAPVFVNEPVMKGDFLRDLDLRLLGIHRYGWKESQSRSYRHRCGWP